MKILINKRRRFIVTSVVLSLGFIGLQFLQDSFRLTGIGILSFFTLVLFGWSLYEGLGKNATLLTLILPVAFTLGVGFFWFLLPISVFTQIPVVVFYGFGIYALCLTANIYTVSAIRTIALLRAARGVGFVLTLLTLFLVFDTIMSLKWPIYFYALLATTLSLPLFYQGFWSIELEKNFSTRILKVSLISSLAIGETSVLLFFWPVTIVVGSLFLTVGAYVLLGLGQAYLEERLFLQTVREYMVVGLAVFIGMFIATNWRA